MFAVFISIAVLIGGVVLLTNKKPEPKAPAPSTILGPVRRGVQAGRRRPRAGGVSADSTDGLYHEGEEDDALRGSDDDDDNDGDRESAMWQIGDDEDDADDVDVDVKKPAPAHHPAEGHEETHALFADHDGDHDAGAGTGPQKVGESTTSRTAAGTATRNAREDDDDFGEWEDGAAPSPIR